MSVNQPLVSIGLPVYNGEQYLRGALEALTGQDYGNIELVISDNCSTDRTQEICREYAARDPRIRYFRTEKNDGAGINFLRVFDLCTGEYFMWAAHDDLWLPSFVSMCVEKLESTPEAALAFTHMRVIDEDGNKISEHALAGAPHPNRATRLRQFLSCGELVYAFYGLARRKAVERALPIRHCWGSDYVFLAKLCLHGTIVVVPEVLFYYRVFQDKTQGSMAAAIGLKSQKRLALAWDVYSGLVRTISASDLPGWERRKMTLLAAAIYGKQWPRWIRLSLADYAYPKYLLPAIKNRESGNRKLAAYYAIRAMAANPFYILSRAWVIPVEAAIGPRLAGMARRFVRRLQERKKK